MVSLQVLLIGAAISYGIALLMKVTLVCITAFSSKKEDKEGEA